MGAKILIPPSNLPGVGGLEFYPVLLIFWRKYSPPRAWCHCGRVLSWDNLRVSSSSSLQSLLRGRSDIGI